MIADAVINIIIASFGRADLLSIRGQFDAWRVVHSQTALSKHESPLEWPIGAGKGEDSRVNSGVCLASTTHFLHRLIVLCHSTHVMCVLFAAVEQSAGVRTVKVWQAHSTCK